MKRLIALTWKELLQLKRDTVSMKLIVGIPLMQLIIFGYAINYDVKHLTTVVLDESRSFESRELVAKMDATDYFDIVGRVDSLGELQQAVDSARAAVGLVIDHDFGKDRHRGAPAKALLIVNASDSTTSTQAMSIVNGITSGVSIGTLRSKANWTSASSVATRSDAVRSAWPPDFWTSWSLSSRPGIDGRRGVRSRQITLRASRC